jgi:anhydro-N-acetylmuramic acid kinase
MWERLRRLVGKPSRIAVGLMSGTSADGVDAALVRLHGHGKDTRVETLAFLGVAYEEAFHRRIVEAYEGGVADVCDLNAAVAERLAAAALAVIAQGGLEPDAVDFIASHGQTLYHIPLGDRPERDRLRAPSTLQVGDGNLIAQRTGIVTLTDFRTADMAAGGGGAPLVPLLDELLFRRPGVRRVVGNIGGIANVTFLGTEQNDGTAFDTGPGNALVDVAAQLSDRALRFDRDGALGAAGQVDEQVLARLLAHPYFEAAPPKTTGRELFSAALVREFWGAFSARPRDGVATLTMFTAASMAGQIVRFAGTIDELVLSGGGIHNPTLMRMLGACLPGVTITTTAAHGLDPDAKEAVAFAVIGNETLHGSPGNVPRATGATRGVVLGKLSMP